MLGRVGAILARLGTNDDDVLDAWPRVLPQDSTDGGTTDEDATDGADAGRAPQLYRCSQCNQVYVAVDKRTCSTCGTSVDLVGAAD